MKKVIAEKYGSEYASEIMKKSKQVYRELVDKAEDVGNDNPTARRSPPSENHCFGRRILRLFHHRKQRVIHL